MKKFISVFPFFFCSILLSVFSQNCFGQNPTVISDSLVIMQRVHAKEELIVDQDALFKGEIHVIGESRFETDVRFDEGVRVDGTAKLNGVVKMENIADFFNINDSTEILVRLPNGQIKAMDNRALVSVMYAIPCGQIPFGFPGSPTVNPIWNNGPNKLYVSYCEDVKTGIGTTDPQFILDVRGLTFLSSLKVGALDANEDAMINGFDVTNSRDLIQLGVHNPAIGNISQVRFKIQHNGTVMLYNYGGHSLIAHDNTGAKILQLENSGLLRAREIKVDETNWPDYVFDKNYKLPKLKDVAKFIDENRHLPGVPSATEIETEGLNLGDMQKIHMQKIEELTLYMIQMDEKMNAMEKRMIELEKENEELKRNK